MKRALAAVATAAIMLATAPQASANPCCSAGWHWFRRANPFTVTMLLSVTSGWQTPIAGAVADWSKSTKLNMVTTPGNSSLTARKNCAKTSGQVHVCNANYGNTGWAGLTEVTVDSRHHITQIRVRLNDATTPARYRRLVSCHEFGHSIGLAHNTRTSSCMKPGAGSRPHPDATDYAELAVIYRHLDTAMSQIGGSGGTRTIVIYDWIKPQ